MIRNEGEAQLKSLQVQFEEILQKSIAEIQDEANTEVLQASEEISRLRHQLDNKEVDTRNNYITIDHHQQIMDEKIELIDKLTFSAKHKEEEHTQEINSKLKNQEDKLTLTFNTEVLKLRGIEHFVIYS